MPEAKDWLLNFHQLNGQVIIDTDLVDANGFLKGLPFGFGTAMAQRFTAGQLPWDEGCKVTTLIGGYETMEAIRDALTKIAADAEVAGPNSDKGYVCITGWRINDFRDITRAGYTTDPTQTPHAIFTRLLNAGVHVRVLVWYQGWLQAELGDLSPHREDHMQIANDFHQLLSGTTISRMGIVGLDLRIGPFTGSHHQKMMVMRSPNTNLAFCGGVDLAYTRRDTPANESQYNPENPKFYDGDKQSGNSMPDVSAKGIEDKQGTDLPIKIYGDGIVHNQKWHDQHLKLEGPIVNTMESQFWERWTDAGRIYPIDDSLAICRNQAIFSVDGDPDLFDDSRSVSSLVMVPPAGESIVQMWRTIPFRDRSFEMFYYGEFTVMAGIANACARARQLIWIFDQYFWSRPLGKLLNKQLKENLQLHVIIVLPPFSDEAEKMVSLQQHRNRRLALHDIIYGSENKNLDNNGQPIDQRVAVFDLWDRKVNLGIYCHAKAQMYDDALLVCGSANLNRRSFTSDTEIDCAVLDTAVVRGHRKKLWTLLFPETPWIELARGITLDMNSDNSGKTFFDYFLENATGDSAKSFLIEDKWANGPDDPILLPNYNSAHPDEDLKRYQYARTDLPGMSFPDNPLFPQLKYDFEGTHFFFNHIIDPSSLPLSIESGNVSLDQVVQRLYKPDSEGKLYYTKVDDDSDHSVSIIR